MKNFDRDSHDPLGDHGASALRAAPGRTCATARLAPRPAVMRSADPAAAGAGGEGARDASGSSSPGARAADDPFGLHLLAPPASVHQLAARGVDTPAVPLPHSDAIRAAFGAAFDVGQIRAHVGGAAREACEDMGASGFATGNDVAFAGDPDLHTAAHEAAHVVQQAQGVSLYGGVGQVGDRYEEHADAVADRVVQGQSSEGLLERTVGASPASTGTVQQKRGARTAASNLKIRNQSAASRRTASASWQVKLDRQWRAQYDKSKLVDPLANAAVPDLHAAIGTASNSHQAVSGIVSQVATILDKVGDRIRFGLHSYAQDVDQDFDAVEFALEEKLRGDRLARRFRYLDRVWMEIHARLPPNAGTAEIEAAIRAVSPSEVLLPQGADTLAHPPHTPDEMDYLFLSIVQARLNPPSGTFLQQDGGGSLLSTYAGPKRNDADDHVVAGVSGVRRGHSDWTVIYPVAPGATFVSPEGADLDIFIFRDGGGVKFHGITGVEEAKTASEVKDAFRQYAGPAKKWFADHPLPAKSPVHRTDGGRPGNSLAARIDSVRKLAQGACHDREERAILQILRDSAPGDVEVIVDAVGFDKLWDQIDGPECMQFVQVLAAKRYFETMNPSTRLHWVARMASGRANANAQELIVSLLESDGAEDVKAIIGAVGNVTLNWKLTGVHQHRYDAVKQRHGLR